MTDKYLQRGVSANKNEVHEAVRQLDHGLYPQAFCKIYPDYLVADPAYCNVMSADGSGTKSILAYLYWRETGDITVWNGIAQDAIVMNLDDLICIGATEQFLLTSSSIAIKISSRAMRLGQLLMVLSSLSTEWLRRVLI